uniref:Uncharacterized protein n=1 Tax=Plectus sambesii TaxID=2011161 RepID=A0A914VWZ6_9BILA
MSTTEPELCDGAYSIVVAAPTARAVFRRRPRRSFGQRNLWARAIPPQLCVMWQWLRLWRLTLFRKRHGRRHRRATWPRTRRIDCLVTLIPAFVAVRRRSLLLLRLLLTKKDAMSVMVAQENHQQIVQEPGKVTASQSMESVHTVAEEEVSAVRHFF